MLENINTDAETVKADIGNLVVDDAQVFERFGLVLRARGAGDASWEAMWAKPFHCPEVL
jgi:hypothetical protein